MTHAAGDLQNAMSQKYEADRGCALSQQTVLQIRIFWLIVATSSSWDLNTHKTIMSAQKQSDSNTGIINKFMNATANDLLPPTHLFYLYGPLKVNNIHLC
jgi:hypothetical protein